MSRGRKRFRALAILLVTAICVPLVAYADHFDGVPATGGFDPQLSASLDRPIEDASSNVNISISQKDHEAPIKTMQLRIPSGWQFAKEQIRSSNRADGTVNNFSCSDALGAPDAQGLKQVERAEVIGKLVLNAVSDVTQPRSQPITYTGDLFWLSWNPPPRHNLALTTGTDSVTGEAFIDATWDADPAGGIYTTYIKRFGEPTIISTTTANTKRFSNLIAGEEYGVAVRYATGSTPKDESFTSISAGAGTVRPRAIICGQLTTRDSRVWNLYTSPAKVDVRQLSFPFSLRAMADGRWEIPADLTSLWKDSNIQAAQVSLLSLTATLFGDSKGNWQQDPSDPTKTLPLAGFAKNPAVTFSSAPWKALKEFEAVFHTCHPHAGGSAQPCGPLAQSDRPDVTKKFNVTIYPGHARPVVTAPAPWAVLIGTSGATVTWEPHSFSYSASDLSKGIKGYAVRVIPLKDSASTQECPASALVCRTSASPVLVGVDEPGISSTSNGRVSLTVNTPADGWYFFDILTLYHDGTTSDDTELASVKGKTLGQFFTSTTPWPYIYLDRTVVTRPAILFVDPGANRFSLELISSKGPKSLSYTVPAMVFVEGSTPGEGNGSLTHTQPGSNWSNNIHVSMVFTGDMARGAYTFEASAGTASGIFNGLRVR